MREITMAAAFAETITAPIGVSVGHRHGRTVDLCSVPSAEWEAISSYGFDSVWFKGLLQDFRRPLPEFRPDDSVGSPYCVRRYVVDARFRGPEGFVVASEELSKRGMNRVLDFGSNQVAPDHPWVMEQPEYFIQASREDLEKNPSSYLKLSLTVFACGKDPYFPTLPDVWQWKAFEPGLRRAVIETISRIADTEYWVDVISVIKETCPGFLFIAEPNGDREWVQQQGFGFCCDKKVRDRTEHANAESISVPVLHTEEYCSGSSRTTMSHELPLFTCTTAAG